MSENEIKRRLDTKQNRDFWAAVDRIAQGCTGSIKIGDPWLDSYKDLSALLVGKRVSND